MNYWNNLESVSGAGSTLTATESVRAQLPVLIKNYKIESICDAPCGDFLWMRDVIASLDVKYKGVDIVPNLVESLKSLETDSTTFEWGDIRTFDFNGFDLIFVRDCLFHFSYQDVGEFLRNLEMTSYKYLLTTSYFPDSTFKNKDIATGFFRHIDLLAPPFNFPQDYLSSIADWVEPESRMYLYLWEKSQVPTELS